jgi:hypothetical protein
VPTPVGKPQSFITAGLRCRSFAGCDPTSLEAADLAERTATITARLLERVPRLERVREIVLGAATSTANLASLHPDSDDAAVEVGAALLRAAQLMETLSHSKLDSHDACLVFGQVFPEAHPALASAFRATYSEPPTERGIPMHPRDLRAGLILHEGVTRDDGATLLRAGRVPTDNHVDKLRLENDGYGDVRLVVVTQASFQELFPDVPVPA